MFALLSRPGSFEEGKRDAMLAAQCTPMSGHSIPTRHPNKPLAQVALAACGLVGVARCGERVAVAVARRRRRADKKKGNLRGGRGGAVTKPRGRGNSSVAGRTEDPILL